MFLLQIALDAGCWVSAPDYEGHSASFTAGRTSGKSTLDTIKGVLSVANKTGLNAEADVILWGYSGGSIASGWAAAMQPWYSPDLKPRLKGVAIGGFAANITKTVLGVDGTFYAGMIPAGMTGLGNEYPIIREYIDKILPQDRRNYFNFVGKQCLAPACIYYLYTNIFKGVNPIVQSGYDVLYEPPVAAILRNTTLGVSKVDMPQIPVFIFHGEKDTIVPFKNTLDVYDSWCDWGIESLEVSSSQTTRHITEAIIGLPAAFTWIMNTFNGVPTVKGCLKTSRFNNLLYPGVDTGIVDLLTSAAKSIFGIELGPDTLKRGQDIDYDAILENYLHALYKKS